MPKGVTRPLPPIELDRPQDTAATAPPRAPTPDGPDREVIQPAPGPAPSIAQDAWLVLALVALAVMSFLPALSGEFLWEDSALVADNALITSPANLGAIFSQPFLPARPNSYHPLATLTFMTDYQVWRLNPEGYHSTNLTLHLVATLLVFALAMQLLRRRRMAFIAGAVFAVHPVHVEPVAWIAARPQLLATCLGLFAMLSYAAYAASFAQPETYRRRAAYYVVSLTTFTLALFAHAAAGALIVLLALYEVILHRRRLIGATKKAILLPYAGFAAGIIVYLLARWHALGYHMAIGFDLTAWPQHIFTLPLWAVRSLELILFPARSQPLHVIALVSSPLSLGVLAAVAALAVIVALAVRLRRFAPAAALSMWWVLLMLAPTLNLLPLRDVQFAERNLYLPSVGMALLAGWGVVQLWDAARERGVRWGQVAVMALFALAVGAGTLLSATRTAWYRDDASFFTRVAETQPAVALPHVLLGNIRLARGEVEAAIREYEAAVKRRPSARAYHNLGNAYAAQGAYEEAARAYRRALELDPASGVSADALAKMLERQRAQAEPGPAPGRPLRR